MVLLRAFPNDEWRRLRITVFVLCCVALLLAASGIFVNKLFHQPTTIKYAFTFIALLTTVRAPLRLLVGLAILAGPIDAVVRIQGNQISPLLAIDALGVIVALPRFARGRSAIRSMVPVVVLLFLPGIVMSSSPGSWIVWLAVTLATGWLAFEVASEPGGIRYIFGMLVLSALAQGTIAIWESKTKHQLNLYSSAGTAATSDEAFFQYGSLVRPAGTFPDPIGFGQFIALCLPLAVVYAASLRRWVAVFAVLCAAGVAGLALMLSLSRLSIVGGGVGLLLALLLLPGRRRAGVAVVTILVGLAVVVISLSVGGTSLTERLNSILNPTAAHVATASTDLQREQIWEGAIRIGEAHPLAGVGLGNVGEYLPRYGVPVKLAAEAQNTPLQYFAEGGVPGLLAVIGIVLAAFTDLAHAFRRYRLWFAGCFAALIATLVTWSTDVVVTYVQLSGMVAILLGVIAAMRVAADNEARAITSKP